MIDMICIDMPHVTCHLLDFRNQSVAMVITERLMLRGVVFTGIGLEGTVAL